MCELKKLSRYMDITKIVVPKIYYGSKPSDKKMNKARTIYKATGNLLGIVLDSNNNIVDGYTTYLVAKENKRKIVPVTIDMGNTRFIKKSLSYKSSGIEKEQIKKYLYNKNSHCYICGRQMTLEHDHDNSFTIDHVIPRSKGGSNNIKNLAGACKVCNEIKANLLYSQELQMKIIEELRNKQLLSNTY